MTNWEVPATCLKQRSLVPEFWRAEKLATGFWAFHWYDVTITHDLFFLLKPIMMPKDLGECWTYCNWSFVQCKRAFRSTREPISLQLSERDHRKSQYVLLDAYLTQVLLLLHILWSITSNVGRASYCLEFKWHTDCARDRPLAIQEVSPVRRYHRIHDVSKA